MKDIIIQGIGFIGMLLAVWSFQHNRRGRILLLQILSSCFWVVHFLLLGAFTGSIMNLISVARGSVFYHRDRKWAGNMIWLYVFMGSFILGAVFTWKNSFSLLPMVAMIISTISTWMKNPRNIRLVMLLSPPCWFTYNLISGSIAGMMTEVIVFSSIIIGVVRFDLLKTPESL